MRVCAFFFRKRLSSLFQHPRPYGGDSDSVGCMLSAFFVLVFDDTIIRRDFPECIMTMRQDSDLISCGDLFCFGFAAASFQCTWPHGCSDLRVCCGLVV